MPSCVAGGGGLKTDEDYERCARIRVQIDAQYVQDEWRVFFEESDSTKRSQSQQLKDLLRFAVTTT